MGLGTTTKKGDWAKIWGKHRLENEIWENVGNKINTSLPTPFGSL